MSDTKTMEKTALRNFEFVQAQQKRTCNLSLTPEEAVALYAHLANSPSFNGRAAIISQLSDTLVHALRRSAKTYKVLQIAEKVAQGMQAELYLKKQERKIAELESESASDSNMRFFRSDDELKAAHQQGGEVPGPGPAPFMGDVEMEMVDVDLDDDDGPVREYPRRTAPRPVMPHPGGRRKGRRRH